MPIFRPFLLTLALALLGFVQTGFAATQAGKVVYAYGDVRAVADSGVSRTLGRGDVFGAGDTIVTRQGRAQLRFSDGGFAALQPDTEYRIEDYHFEGKADGGERSFLNLLRGSVRLVTGLIGRANKQNFRLRTPVATIGIRGTSGKISHCEANCGERGPGTSLAGYGGEWDLNSGAFSGPVKPGQAKFCNGASCFDIPGFGQRSEVESDGGTLAEGDSGEDGGDSGSGGAGTTEPVFQAGVQTGDDGLCVLGNCAQAEILVATGQNAAAALNDSAFDGDTGSGEDLAVVLRNGEPIAVVDLETTTTGAPEVFLLTTDLNAVRTAVERISSTPLRNGLLSVLDALPDGAISALNENPASVAPEDFGRTSDNQLVFGRWQNGSILEVEANPTGGITDLEVRRLEGFASEHFIFGPDPVYLPVSGRATYALTGATRSTSTDGRTIGFGATSGKLSFDFTTRTGLIDFTVRHAERLFASSGTLELDGLKSFRDDDVTGFSRTSPEGPTTLHEVFIEGFFAGRNGNQAPLAAGLSYVIRSSAVRSDIIGVAGFGLADFVPVSIVPVPNGSFVGFAHGFEDNGTLAALALGFIVDGASNLAFQQSGVVVDFFASGDPACLAGCALDALDAVALRDATGPGGATSLPALGVSWARFAGNYVAEHAALDAEVGSAHVIAATMPTPVAAIPNLGSGQQGVYNLLRGGTRPTVVYETNGSPAGERVGQLTSASVAINFDNGDVNASFAGSFPDGAGTALWNLSGAPVSTCPGSAGCFVRSQAVHTLDLTGQVLSSRISNPQASNFDCSDGCFLSGRTRFDLIGSNAPGGIAGAYQAETDQSIEPAFSLSGTYVLQGSVGPVP